MRVGKRCWLMRFENESWQALLVTAVWMHYLVTPDHRHLFCSYERVIKLQIGNPESSFNWCSLTLEERRQWHLRRRKRRFWGIADWCDVKMRVDKRCRWRRLECISTDSSGWRWNNTDQLHLRSKKWELGRGVDWHLVGMLPCIMKLRRWLASIKYF